MDKSMNRFAAFLILLPGVALAQGYDDPRVTDYAADLQAIARAQKEISDNLAAVCQRIDQYPQEIRSSIVERCAHPIQWPKQMSVDEFRQRLQEQQQRR
jgi:hypothetical protein